MLRPPLFPAIVPLSPGVGKTSLLNRFCENDFSQNMISTAGVDFKNRFFEVEGKKVKVQIWDTAGQERFRVITRGKHRAIWGCCMRRGCLEGMNGVVVHPALVVFVRACLKSYACRVEPKCRSRSHMQTGVLNVDAIRHDLLIPQPPKTLAPFYPHPVIA